MLKRLGMWNRLALVLSVLAVAIVPVTIYQSYVSQAYVNREHWYQDCRRINAGTGAGDLKAWLQRDEKCTDILTKPIIKPSSGFYWEQVFLTAFACVIVYGLIWIVVATGKWIWRGRDAGKEPSPVRATPLGSETD